MIAGILSRFGKIGVIIGFIVGNILLAYVVNGNTVSIIYLKEIVLASLGLLLVPKNVQINIEDFFDKNLYLPVSGSYNLENNTDTINKEIFKHIRTENGQWIAGGRRRWGIQ